jgi:hypothetical protein
VAAVRPLTLVRVAVQVATDHLLLVNNRAVEQAPNLFLCQRLQQTTQSQWALVERVVRFQTETDLMEQMAQPVFLQQ